MSDPHVALDTALAGWLAGRLPELRDITVRGLERPKAGGFSAETVLFEAHGIRDGQPAQRGLVLRRQIRGHELLHQTGLQLEARVMRQLAALRRPGLPVPDVVGAQDDDSVLGTPFIVVERLPGRIVPQHPNYNTAGWVHDLAPAQRRQVWHNGLAAMARVHQVDWREGGGFGFLSRGKSADLAGLIAWIEDWYRWALAGRDHPVGEAALAYLKQHLPAQAPVGLVWGDAIPANMLFGDDGQVHGLIDWELAMLGPGEIDLAWWLLFDDLFSQGYGVPRLDGLPDRAETVAVYEQALGRPVRDLPYYEIMAWLRMSIVSTRAVDRLVAQGRFKADNDAWCHHPCAATLARLLGLPPVTVGADFFAFSQTLMTKADA